MTMNTVTINVSEELVELAVEEHVRKAMAAVFSAKPPVPQHVANPAPAIGDTWNGGTYAGITLHENQPMHLVLLPGEESKDWGDAKEWAAKQGGELPSRMDALVLWQNIPERFAQEAYWTGTPYAGDAGYAWSQYFFNGDQGITLTGLKLRARAVRRLTI
jgi:hypothetical protein